MIMYLDTLYTALARTVATYNYVEINNGYERVGCCKLVQGLAIVMISLPLL